MAWHPEPDEDVRTEVIPPAGNESMREVDLDTAVRRQTPIRMRVIQVGVLLTLVFVFGGLVFRGYWAGQSQPTTVAGYDPSMNAAIFSNVNYGTVTVNGKKLDAHPPVIVTLHDGMNTITISASPFRAQTCTFDLSRRRIAGGQCMGGGSVSSPPTIGGKQVATWIDIQLTPADLPSEQQQSVAAVVAQVIDGIVFHTTVPAHQYIVTGVDAQGHITSRLTDTALQANVALVPYAGQVRTSDATCVENLCAGENNPRGLCSVSDASGTATTGWRVTTIVVPQWRFTTRTGDTSALSPLNVDDQQLLQVSLQFDAAHGWRLWGAPGWGNDCDARDIMANIQCGAGSSALSAYGPVNIASVSPNGIEGCDIQVLNSSGKFARFIWRFGVLLAADAQAKKMIPSIPLAPQAEIDAVTKQA